eukprot:11218472-Lingulodinium_polyedra.AAC.2
MACIHFSTTSGPEPEVPTTISRRRISGSHRRASSSAPPLFSPFGQLGAYGKDCIYATAVLYCGFEPYRYYRPVGNVPFHYLRYVCIRNFRQGPRTRRRAALS